MSNLAPQAGLWYNLPINIAVPGGAVTPLADDRKGTSVMGISIPSLCVYPNCSKVTRNNPLCPSHRGYRHLIKSLAQPLPSTAIKTHPLSRNCYHEKKALQNNLARARKSNRLATLTLDQWLFTLDYFEWKCAYCRVREYAMIEHFIPVEFGGGTTADNCVPACYGCNCRKSGYHPFDLPQSIVIMRDDINRVCKYLRILREQEAIQLSLFK